MRRYEMEIDSLDWDDDGPSVFPKESEHGEWVRHADAEARDAERRDKIDRLEEEIERWKRVVVWAVRSW